MMRIVLFITGLTLFVSGAYFYSPDNPWLCIPGLSAIIAVFPINPYLILISIGLIIVGGGFYFFEPDNLWLSGFGGLLIIIGIVFYSNKTLRDNCIGAFQLWWNSTPQSKKVDEFSLNVAEATEENKSFIDGYAFYRQGKFNEAKICFQNQIDNYPNSSEAKVSQAQLCFMSAIPPSSNFAVITLAMFVSFVFRDKPTSFDSALELADFIAYGAIGVITIYWIYYSFRWPNVFEARARLGSAIAWLWFIGFSTVIIGILEASNVIDVGRTFLPNAPNREASDTAVMLVAGFILAIMAYMTTKISPFIDMIILFLASIIWAADTASMLSIVVFAQWVPTLKLGVPIYTSSILHLIALNAVIKGIGSSRALDCLGKVKVGV